MQVCHSTHKKSTTFVQTLDELDKKREELARFYSMCDAIRPKNCEGAFFIIRNANAAVHSEPDITEARIFMSIMSATEEEIKEHLTHLIMYRTFFSTNLTEKQFRFTDLQMFQKLTFEEKQLPN